RDNITISPSQGGTVQSLVVRITGIYKVRVTNSLGCIVFSAPYSYIVTNTNDPLLRSVIHVYPTLASNEIYAVLSSNVSGMFTFKVMNSVGQMVKQFQKRKAGVEQIMKISLADLSSGYYFLYISNSGRESVWKFYKQ
ncbi:MAG TPA: T9SS type A sorting domain-containing protein, partial [Chitinophagaceae bacterium]